MSKARFIFDGPEGAPVALALAHGAGAPMDSPFMAHIAQGLGARGLRVARFEFFPYMVAARANGKKRPPDRTPVLLESWHAAIAELGGPGGQSGLAIGGKSLGGRMASLIADEAGVRALVCLGYPFHPPGKPDTLRTEHLEGLETPCLILQGERDPLGTRDEVAGYRLSPAIRIAWCPDGDHSLKPRKASGRRQEDNWDLAVEVMYEFLTSTAP
jgi:predicted alpha/beta-hydrolase family hydrolase